MASETADFKQSSISSYYQTAVGDLQYTDSRLAHTSQG